MKHFIFIGLVISLCLGCPKGPVVHYPTDTAKCPDACTHLRILGCPEGDDLPDGTTCESFCAQTQNKGHALTPSCVVRIKECSDMDHLEDFCPKK